MAGQRIEFSSGVIAYIDYQDGEGSAVVNGIEYRWYFHEYCGPTFLRKDGEPLVRQPGEKHPVWDAFGEWLKKYREARENTPRHEIVSV